MRSRRRTPVLLIALALVCVFAQAQPASALDNGLARTPYMGWNTFYGLGSAFDENTLHSVTDAIGDRGLKAAGYDYVWIDGGWWNGTRDASGAITVDPQQWPHGMKAVADYIHSKGLKAGIYTDAGQNGCGGADQGSFGHYQQDADTFAAWGYDAVKVDFCGGTQLHLDPAVAYRQFRDALLHNSSGRPMLFNICNPFRPGAAGNDYPPLERSVFFSHVFGPDTGNSWRTDTDVGFVHSILWPDVLRNIDTNNEHPEAAGPGHWNDPDYLGPELGMTADQARAQFSLWALSAAPLVIGSDVRALSDQTIAMLTNRRVIAIDQDPLGVQGRAIATNGDAQVWVKPLANGDRAVLLLNRGETPLTVDTTAAAAGMPGSSRYALRDLWTDAVTSSAGRIAAVVDPDSAVLMRVAVQKGNDLPPATTLSHPTIDSAGPLDLAVPGQAQTITASFQNDARTAVSATTVRLQAPDGWTVSGGPAPGATVAPGKTLRATWTLTPAAGTLPGAYTLTASATYTFDDDRHDSRAAHTTVTVPQAPPAGAGFLSDHGWLDATSGFLVAEPDASVGTGPIVLQGQQHAKGIGVASPSRVDYYLGANCTRLTALIGIDDAVNNVDPSGGTATFQVIGDGRVLYDSGVVDRTATHPVDVDVSGVQQLRLAVGDAGDGGFNDRADWADVRVQCAGPVATVPDGPWPRFVATAQLSATASSAHDGFGPEAAIDGRLTTIWHTEFSPPAPLPQSITVDLGSVQEITGLTYQPRLDPSPNGTITGYAISVSSDGQHFADATEGSWAEDRDLKSATLPTPSSGRFVRLTATGGVAGFASAAEIAVAVR
jgi:alpha-galactosidase